MTIWGKAAAERTTSWAKALASRWSLVIQNRGVWARSSSE